MEKILFGLAQSMEKNLSSLGDEVSIISYQEQDSTIHNISLLRTILNSSSEPVNIGILEEE